MERNVANRRNILIGSGAAIVAAAAGTSVTALFGSTAALAQEQFDAAALMAPKGGVKDHPLGNLESKVTLIEYLSPTCPHCKAFLDDTFPALKAEYIDTNKIHIPRPFVRNVLDAVVFMLAEAAGEVKYHEVVDTYFKTQNEWAVSQTPADAMFAIAQQLGFTKESYDAALTNQALFSGLEQMRDQASSEFKLAGTPTFYLNGKMLAAGEITIDQLKAQIDPLLSAA
jgi:protein-disulfide isomerase